MSRAERTRAVLVGAALGAFARRGIKATTLEHVAARANLTRGAIYWHFPDKLALVRAVFDDLVGPFDVGADIDPYLRSADPMRLLREVLCHRMKGCVDDPVQRQMMEIVLRCRGSSDLPEALADKLDAMALLSLQRLTAVLEVVRQRGRLRPHLKPLDVARCVLAAGLGALAENANALPNSLDHAFFLVIELVLVGACVE